MTSAKVVWGRVKLIGKEELLIDGSIITDNFNCKAQSNRF